MTSSSLPPLIVLGCGFIGGHLARAALTAGRTVRVCARGTGRLASLGAVGAEVKYLDLGMLAKIPQAVSGLHGATVVYSAPPITTLRPGQSIRAAMQAAYGIGAGAFIYLSSSGLYGALPDDEAWIDEDTPLAVDPDMRNIEADDAEVQRCEHERLRTVVLRPAPVYAPGRGVRARLRKGDYKLLDEGEHYISRIFLDDLVRAVFACEDKAPMRALYMVADDEPTTQKEYATYLCDKLGLPLPPSRALYQPGGARVVHRNRRLRNTRLKSELGFALTYPTYREGEAAIDAAEAAADT